MPTQITDWNAHFENNRSRELKHCDWVPVPNRMDGDGYTEFVDHPNAAAHLGAWLAIVEIASRREPRGSFDQSPRELPKFLSRISRLPAAVFEEVIPRLLRLGWLVEVLPQKQENAVRSQGTATTSQDDAETSHDDASRVRARAVPFSSLPFPSVPQEKGSGEKPEHAPQNRFEEWWAMWEQKRGSNHRGQAARAWLSCVTPANVEDCFACTESYFAAAKAPEGYNPEGFLMDQSQDDFKARWRPKAREPTEPKGTSALARLASQSKLVRRSDRD